MSSDGSTSSTASTTGGRPGRPESRDISSDSPVIDPNVPSTARAYSALLGGKDVYESDRKIVAALEHAFGDPQTAARTNRQWLIRVVRWLSSTRGINQFLDCGSGMPEAENVHEVAQRYNPQARVVYNDNDPTVLAYGRALLAANEHTAFVGEDFRDPQKVLNSPEVQRLIDFDEPVAMIHCFSLHHFPDEPRPVKDILDEYMAAFPSGSYLALTHITYPRPENDPTGRAAEICDEIRGRIRELGMDSGYWRNYDHVLSYFDGLEMVPPGLVRTAEWWPSGPPALTELDDVMFGGVARKP